MANELEIAGRTELIAQAMREARTTLQTTLTAVNRIDPWLRAEQATIGRLRGSAEAVASAEQTAEAIGRSAGQTRSHGQMEQWNDADAKVSQAFQQATVDAGHIAGRIGGGQRYLDGYREELAFSSGKLDRALDHLGKLEELPGFAESAEGEGLRSSLQHLKVVTAGTDAGLQNAIEQLDPGRRAVHRLETAELQRGESLHSRAVAAAQATMTTSMSEATNSLQRLGKDIYAEASKVDHSVNVGVAIAHAGNEAKVAAEEAAAAEAAAGEATPQAADVAPAAENPTPQATDVATALRAAGNPTPRAAQHVGAAAAGVQDPRHWFAQGNDNRSQTLATRRGE